MSYAQRPLLTQDCMACNREAWQPMCDLCSDLERAEAEAQESRDEEPNYAND